MTDLCGENNYYNNNYNSYIPYLTIQAFVGGGIIHKVLLSNTILGKKPHFIITFCAFHTHDTVCKQA